jgi:hypothetical protein
MTASTEPADGRDLDVSQTAATDAIHLSFVATSRNDDHGGSLTRRTQHFVDGLIAQCKRHGLRAELILVDWNPPPDKKPLIRELRWPADSGPCDIRVVTVPLEVHQTFKHADNIRLFQMLAKNAGIRRARGKFILATNIDILFSDDAIRFLRDRLQPGFLYLADRVDVPADVPSADGFDAVLRFCEGRAFRVNAGALTVERGAGRWRFRDMLKTAVGARAGYFIDLIEKFCALAADTIANPRWAFRRLLGHGLATAEAQSQERSKAGVSPRLSRTRLNFLLLRGAWDIACSVASGMTKSLLQLRMPFTNACGDFTAMSRDDWLRVRGYAEWNIFSWHLDTLLVYQAIGCGVRIRRLTPKACVYHIDHSGGYAPQQAAELFARLKARGIPFITDEELRQLYADITRKKRSGEDTQLNESGWGLVALPLTEARPTTT